MGRFFYQARDGHGELATGVVNAESVEQASQILRSEGKFIVKITHAQDQEIEEDPISIQERSHRVKRKDVIFFAHQMSVMVETGVPLTEGLETASQQCQDPIFRAVLADVTATVQAGGDFSGALRKYPKVFPTVMTSLLHAGEISGTMGPMLERVSIYLTKEYQTIKQARGALVYPLFMVVMATGVTIFLLAFVLPRFANIYASRGASLPAPTRMLLFISECLLAYWYLWIGLLTLFGGIIFLMKRSKSGRRMIDALKLRLPLMGSLYKQLYLTRACRTMGTMIAAGVSMLDMIVIVKQVTDNAFYEDLWDEVDDQLRQGAMLSEPLFRSDLIPQSVAQMIHSGEKSGQLGKVMNSIAEFTETEFDQTIKSTTAMIEPIMIAVMGAIIGFVAISLLLPIFTISRVISGH